MQSSQNRNSEVVILNAGRSLLRQLSQPAQRRWGLSVRAVTSHRSAVMATAMDDAVSTIIDATANPQAALEMLEYAVSLMGPGKPVVYTEVMHAGLELSVRRAGVLLLLGPMSQAEWRGFFEPRLRRHLARSHQPNPPQHRRQAGRLRNPAAGQWREGFGGKYDPPCLRCSSRRRTCARARPFVRMAGRDRSAVRSQPW